MVVTGVELMTVRSTVNASGLHPPVGGGRRLRAAERTGIANDRSRSPNGPYHASSAMSFVLAASARGGPFLPVVRAALVAAGRRGTSRRHGAVRRPGRATPALAEHLDPEHVKRLVESCFERLIDDIEAFGGSVDKVLGDAIVALFGAPVAHEDDAERAVRAALRMQETLAAVRRARRGRRRRRRAASRCASGSTPARCSSARSPAPTTRRWATSSTSASRLQAMAPPGAVLIGDATAALCSPAVRREPFGARSSAGANRSSRRGW